jgi:hypothetical protein
MPSRNLSSDVSNADKPHSENARRKDHVSHPAKETTDAK